MANKRRSFLQAAGTISIAGMAGCSGLVGGGSSGSITIGSKRFAEQEILGHMSIIALQENTDLEVTDETGLGGTSQNLNALENGEIDSYWTYTGTLWHQILGKDEVIADRDTIYSRAKQAAEEEKGLTLTSPSKSNHAWTIIARPNWAEQHGIASISDFAEYVNEGNTDFTFVSYTEYAEREDGLPALVEDYSIDDSAWGNVDLKKVGYGGLNYQILNDEQGVATSGWRTQPQIFKYDLRILEDDKNHFSDYSIAPIVSQDVLDEHPEVGETLDPLAPSITTENMQEMNLKVSLEDEDASAVARNHLESEGLI